MLRRNKRIHRQEEFAAVVKKGASKKTQCFVVKILPNKLGFNRYGFVISKKIEKLAVNRNKKRRQTYEIISHLNVPSEPSSDIVLLARKPIMKMPFSEMQNAIKELLT